MTQLARSRDRLVLRFATDKTDAGVALLSAILFMVLVAGLSIVLVSAVLNQMFPTALAQKRTATIYAAQAGMQTALDLLRSAATAPDANGNVYGAPSQLPCALSGNVNAQNDGITYMVTVQYFLTDPTGMSSSWLSSHQMTCRASNLSNPGVSVSGVSTSPKFAYLISSGLGSAALGVSTPTLGNRSVAAVYQFKVSNVNLAGGRIFDANSQYCLDAVTATAGSNVQFLPLSQCTNDAQELWSNGPDYQLKLASTTTNSAAGLCITGPLTATGPTQNAILQPCLATTDPNRWNQLWSWTGSYSWQGQNQSIGTGPSNYFLATGYSAGVNIAGKFLLVNNGANGTFTPSTAVGAGAAGYSTHQLVNYKEFGRCADVTAEQITASFMISYPCKQDPTGTGTYLKWNHHWYYTEPTSGATSSAPQQIYVNVNNVNTPQYCLTTPSSTGTAPFFPTFSLCNGTSQQMWVRVNDTGVYATSYWMTDTYGRCLQADSSPSTTYSSNYSELDVASCNGSDAQKWNAPATHTTSTVGGYREIG